MVVTKTFDVDLVRLEVPPTWACMQGDANSRAICYRLYADGSSYEIPSGVSLRIAYEKADKTSGVYSQLPDGSSAYEISGNTVTIRLIEDISAKSGMALVQPILYDSDGNTLGIWYTEIIVRRGVSKESSSTGVNYSSYENDIGTLQAKVKRLESLVDGGSTPETYGITQSCTNCTSSSNISAVNKNDSFTATYTPDSGYSSVSFIVKMGGTDITTSSVSGNKVTISKVTGNVAITANGVREITYTVSFSGVSGIPSQTVAAGGYASEPATPTKDGYIFDGWYNGNSKWNFKTDKVTSNITLTAKFNELKKYTITTNYSESGIPSKTTTVNSGESYSATIEIPYANYRFESATVKMGGMDITSTALSGKKVTINKVTDNVVITVNVNQTFQIIKTTRGVTLSNTTSVIAKGSSYECTVTPTSGYNAVTITVRQGSSTGTDVTGKYVSGNKINIPSVTFDVYITANGVREITYTVSFSGVSGIPSQTVAAGGYASEPATPTKDGYIFDGWYNGNSKWNFKTDKVTSNITLTAKFNELKKYTITTNYSESGIPSKTTTVNSGESYSATIEIPYANYRFESATVKMGGMDITSTALSGKKVTINKVTDNVVITVNVNQTFQIIKTTRGVTLSNTTSVIAKGSSYECTVTPTSGYNAVTITVRQGSSTGTDVTGKYVSGNKINIPSVTFDVYITANGYTLSNYDVVNNLTNCTTSNNATTVEADAHYTATVTRSGDYKLKALTVKMGGTDITRDVVTYSTGSYGIRTYISATIDIPKVTGKVEITGTGAMWHWMKLTYSSCSKKQTTGCVDDSVHANYAWDGDTFVQAYKPDKGYTSVSITVKRGGSSGTDVTSNVVGKTTIDGVSYDSVTISNVKDEYYIRASGTT